MYSISHLDLCAAIWLAVTLQRVLTSYLPLIHSRCTEFIYFSLILFKISRQEFGLLNINNNQEMKLGIYFLVGLPVLFVTYTVCEASSASQLTELTYIYVKNVLPDDQSVISSTVTRSKLSCASTCQRESVTKGCTIAVYNRTTKHCTLTNGTFGSLIYTDDNDTLTLYPQRGELFYIIVEWNVFLET